MIADNNSPNGSIEIYEISPFILKATTELDQLVKQRHAEGNKVQLLLKRVDQLENEVHSATVEIRSILKSLQP